MAVSFRRGCILASVTDPGRCTPEEVMRMLVHAMCGTCTRAVLQVGTERLLTWKPGAGPVCILVLWGAMRAHYWIVMSPSGSHADYYFRAQVTQVSMTLTGAGCQCPRPRLACHMCGLSAQVCTSQKRLCAATVA